MAGFGVSEASRAGSGAIMGLRRARTHHGGLEPPAGRDARQPLLLSRVLLVFLLGREGQTGYRVGHGKSRDHEGDERAFPGLGRQEFPE
jgi:hypothetical protein